MGAAVAGSSRFQVLVRGSSLLQSYGSAVFKFPSFQVFHIHLLQAKNDGKDMKDVCESH